MTPSGPALVESLFQDLILELRDWKARVGMIATIPGCLVIAAALVSPPSIASDGSTSAARNLASACAMCHGTNGVSAGGIPSLAGQSREYLEMKLQDFRTGRSPATIMQQIARGYSAREIALLASYFAAQDPVRSGTAASSARIP